MNKFKIFNREISWLAFNHRVLQEAMDESVPLYERIKFMAIFSSNLDEFFRVRVAALRNLIALSRKTQKKLDFDPEKLLKQIHEIVFKQQEELGSIHRLLFQKELKKRRIYLLKNDALSPQQQIYLKNYFNEHIQSYIAPVFPDMKNQNVFLEDKALYFFLQAGSDPKNSRFILIKIPSPPLDRFIQIPSENGGYYFIFIDDVLRLCINQILPEVTINEIYAIKLSRDAEIYIEDEFGGDLIAKIKKGLQRRKTGVPCRLLYDQTMPASMLKILRKYFGISKEDLIAGGRYHNYNDFFSFPKPYSRNLVYPRRRLIKIKMLESAPTVYKAIEKNDILLYYPYHTFNYFLLFLKQAVKNPATKSIKITLYRASRDSQVIRSLIQAARQGIKVTVFVELMARFDEESNIKWAETLEAAGALVLHSLPKIKVHAKMCLISTQTDKLKKEYLYLSSGNLNEKTAQLYTDIGFFTCDRRLTGEANRIFNYLVTGKKPKHLKHLLVAPFTMRRDFYSLVDNEITSARQGKKAEIFIKVNSVQDPKIIKKLYEASNAGVKIKMVVRGICCVMPGIKNMSENIEIISIIDRYLEHSRIYYFYNDGDPKYFLASADWMTRNLSRRIEVAFPVYNPSIKQALQEIMAIHWFDNVKARIIDKGLKNKYRESNASKKMRSQKTLYEYFVEKQ